MAARKKLSTKRKRNRGTGGDETPVETNSNKRFRPEDRKTIEPTTENLDNQESLEMQHDHVETAISQLTFNQPENTGSNQVPSQVQGAEKAIMVYDLTEEVNEDCLHLPDPKKDWGHHRWRPETNAILIAASSTEMIKLVPKGENLTFAVHKEILTYYSPYYRDAFNGRWRDGEKDTFDVETTPAALALFIKWFYTGTLQNARGETDWDVLLDLYIIADMQRAVALQRDIMTVLFQTHRVEDGKLHSFANVAKAYDNLPAKSPMRSFMCLTYRCHYNPTHDDYQTKFSRITEAPVPFLFDLLTHRTLVALRERYAVCCSSEQHQCDFHGHEGREELLATCGGLSLGSETDLSFCESGSTSSDTDDSGTDGSGTDDGDISSDS